MPRSFHLPPGAGGPKRPGGTGGADGPHPLTEGVTRTADATEKTVEVLDAIRIRLVNGPDGVKATNSLTGELLKAADALKSPIGWRMPRIRVPRYPR